MLQCHTIRMTRQKVIYLDKVILPPDFSFSKHTHGVGLEAQIIINIIEQMLCQTTMKASH